MNYNKVIISVSLILLFVAAGTAQTTAKCGDPSSPLSALIKVEKYKNFGRQFFSDDNRIKIPLILIHGIHGTGKGQSVNEIQDYWDHFIVSRWTTNADLRNKYALYIFQYCSDRESVSTVAIDLGKAIDRTLPDKKPLILAHSMGGLVAKSYMVYYKHSAATGNGLGGDKVLGLITLATPHHGTPGANSADALDSAFAGNKTNDSGWQITREVKDLIGSGSKAAKKTVFSTLNFLYWNISTGFFSPPVFSSNKPNRADLRWDDFDNRLCSENRLIASSNSGSETGCHDKNNYLANTNKGFVKYADKTMLYAGILDSKFHDLTTQKADEFSNWMVNVLTKGGSVDAFRDNPLDNHEKLEIANWALLNLLNENFGLTDGMVPYQSALLCKSGEYLFSKLPPNFVCVSDFRVRRFEFGGRNALSNELPDAKTKGIDRRKRGYDHEDMFQHPDVLAKVVEDLTDFAGKVPPVEENLPPIIITNNPTLFLFDVSGSMAENNKIEQARAAGLDALREIRENAKNSPTPVSVLTFAGDNCDRNVTQNLLGFTTNLTEAETVMTFRIPQPNGGTPLPQALQTSINTLNGYLSLNSQNKEGRIVVLSDGQSTCGDIRPAGVYSRRTDLRVGPDGRIKFLTVGFDVPPGSAAERDLQYLADLTGGKYFNATDRRQLIRAFQKLVRVFVPKSSRFASHPDFTAGINAFLRFDYISALKSFRAYTDANDADPFGWYNLALAYEALDRYKAAGDFYRKYLSLYPNAPDRPQIETKINQLRQDRIDLFNYYAAVIQSDLDYLKQYYQSIFNRNSAALAAEFSGFVSEKRDFYKNLFDILEINERWLLNDSKDLSDSLDNLAARTKNAAFDQDAVSLLTIPIGQLEELIERLDKYGTQNIR